MRLAMDADPVPINEIIATGPKFGPIGLINTGLTRIDAATLEPGPELATKWEVSPDGLTWTFTLRSGVKWHDGQPFTADDVKFTYDSILDPAVAANSRTTFSNIASVNIVDASTVKFTLAKPLVSLPYLVVNSMMPKHLLGGKDLRKATEYNTSPIGTGPFRVKRVVPGSAVELEAFPDFYRGKPHLDGIIYSVIPDPAVRIAQLLSGELDYSVIEPPSLSAVQNNKNIVLSEFPTLVADILRINHNKKYVDQLFTDKRVRQAMTYGLDRQAIMQAATLGHASLMVTPVPPGSPFWFDDTLKPYPFDVAKAKSLFAEAGWTPGADGVLTKNGQRFAFAMTLESTSGVRIQVAELAQQYWKALGIDATVDKTSRQVYVDRLLGGTYGGTVSELVGMFDPDYHRVNWASNGAQAYSYFNDPEVDRLLNAAASEADKTKRQSLYKQFQAIMYDQCYVVPGFHPNEIQAANVRLKGLPKGSGGVNLKYTDSWYLEKS